MSTAQTAQSRSRALAPVIGAPHPHAVVIYCTALWLLPFMTSFARFAHQDTVLIFGIRVDFAVQSLLLAIALLAWLKSPRDYEYSRPRNVFLGLLIGAWAYLYLVDLIHGGQAYREYLIVAVAVFMLWAKPPRRDGLLRSIVAMLTIITLIEAMNVMTADGRATWLTSYSLPWNQHLGLDFAWTSYVVWPAFSGFIAACVLALAFSLSGLTRWVFAILGAIGVMASASESMIIGAILGTIVFALGVLQGRQRLVAGALALGGLATIAFIISSDPTGSGRVPLWTQWLGVWTENPLLGANYADLAIVETTGHLHPHNLFINTLVKSGLIGLIAVVAVFAMLFVITGARAFRGDSAPLALAVVVTIGAMTDYEPRLYNWSIGLVFLVLAGLLATSRSSTDRQQAIARP